MNQPFFDQFQTLKQDNAALRDENKRLKRQVELLESSNASLLFEKRKLKSRSAKRLHRAKAAEIKLAEVTDALEQQKMWRDVQVET